MLKLNKKTMRTQKERIDNGRKIFNDTLVEYSVSDNIYEAISEWRFIYKVDCYSYDGDEKFIKELLKNASNSDRFDKLEINYYEDGYGNCICGQNNLRYVFYIQNKLNNNVLHTGSDCINKVFPDGSILKEDILLLDKILKRSKRSVTKIREENKNLKTENKELKSKIDELENYLKSEEEFSENVRKLFSKDKIELTKKIESLEDEIKRLKDINNNLSIYKKMYGSEMDKEFDKLLFQKKTDFKIWRN